MEARGADLPPVVELPLPEREEPTMEGEEEEATMPGPEDVLS